jgi:hypothetical protein
MLMRLQLHDGAELQHLSQCRIVQHYAGHKSSVTSPGSSASTSSTSNLTKDVSIADVLAGAAVVCVGQARWFVSSGRCSAATNVAYQPQFYVL